VLFYGVYDLRATAARTRSLPGLQQQLSSYVSGSDDLFDDPRASPLKAVAPGLFPPCFIVGAGTDTWCLLADACPGALSRREPLRAARDGRHAAWVHADERARRLSRGDAPDVGLPGA
jgi:hypothetical protein